MGCGWGIRWESGIAGLASAGRRARVIPCPAGVGVPVAMRTAACRTHAYKVIRGWKDTHSSRLRMVVQTSLAYTD